jgi:hypothetical protein
MGNEESMMAGGDATATGMGFGGAASGAGSAGGGGGAANRPAGPGSGSANPSTGATGLGFGLSNLSNLGNNLSNTMSNLSASSGALLRPPGGSANSNSFNNLANLGSNLTSNLSNLSGNLTSNLSNIGGSLAGNLASNLGANLTGNASQSGPSASVVAAKPATAEVPDVDLSGLTEEEKAMIQSVMMRAQESETGASRTAATVALSAQDTRTGANDLSNQNSGNMPNPYGAVSLQGPSFAPNDQVQQANDLQQTPQM